MLAASIYSSQFGFWATTTLEFILWVYGISPSLLMIFYFFLRFKKNTFVEEISQCLI